MKAIILAAGYATRLYPLTENMPKALLDVAGHPILEHVFDAFAFEKEIDEIHIVTNSRFYAQLKEWSASIEAKYQKPIVVWDDGTSSNDTRLGAIGDIQFVIDKAHIADDIFIAASDNLLSEPLDGYFEDFRRHGRDLLLAGRLADTSELSRYAILQLNDQGRVINLEEKPQNPKTNIAAFAEYIYTKATVKRIAAYLAEGNNPDSPGHFPEWLYRQEDVRAYIYPGTCVDIGTLKMYSEVCAQWAK